MAENLDILNAAVSLLVKAAPLAARFSELVRRRSLKRLVAKVMPIASLTHGSVIRPRTDCHGFTPKPRLCTMCPIVEMVRRACPRMT